MKDSKLKIFLGSGEIADIMSRLHRAFDNMGIVNEYFCLKEYKFSDGERVMPLRLKRYWMIRKLQKNRCKIIRGFLELGIAYEVLSLFIYSLKNFNAYIYIYGEGLFSRSRLLRYVAEIEFFLLKLFRKKVIVLLCGSDSRAPYCDGAPTGDIARLRKRTRKTKKKIGMLEKYAILIDIPASSHFHTKKYIRLDYIGIPVDSEEIVDKKRNDNNRVVLLHAPSNMKGKGTTIIRQIVKEIKEIKEMDLPIEYIEISGVPHNAVLEQMAQSDILIDQVFCDTPMAGLAAEAAINSLPTIISGYYSKQYKKIHKEPIPPSLYCEPSELKEKIIWLIQNEKERVELGKAAKDFIINNWISEKYAQKYIDILQDNYPEEWWFNPEENEYIWGAGCSKEEIISRVVSMIDKYGMKSLELPPDSKLYKKYYKLYRENCKHDEKRKK